MNQKDLDTLEQLIDRGTLASVVNALAVICHGKHLHITENWQDFETARPWGRVATKLENTARYIQKESL